MEVVGVSGDGLDMQSDFIDKHGIKYPLLCDIEGIARSKFQVGKGPFGMIEGSYSKPEAH